MRPYPLPCPRKPRWWQRLQSVESQRALHHQGQNTAPKGQPATIAKSVSTVTIAKTEPLAPRVKIGPQPARRLRPLVLPVRDRASRSSLGR